LADRTVFYYLRLLASCCCRKKREIDFAVGQGTYKEEIKKIEMGGLSSYNMLKNDKYKSVYAAYVQFAKKLQTK